MGERAEAEKSKGTGAEAKSSSTRTSSEGRPKTGGLAAPSAFDLGELAVGRVERKQLFVANLEGTDAALAIRYSGDPAIAIENAPEILRPSREGFDPNAAIEIVLNPAAKGHFAGVMSIIAEWPHSTRAPEETHVRVTAAAHEVGHPDLAQEEAEQARVAADAKEAEAREKRLDAAEAVADARDKKGEMPGLPAFVRQFDREIERYGAALQSVRDVRNAGVETARTEVAAYQRRPEKHEESVLEALATAALEIVGVGLAGAIGAALEARLMESSVVAAHTNWVRGAAVAEASSAPSRVVVAAVTDSVKELSIRGTKAAASVGAVRKTEPKRAGDASDAENASIDPVARFFESESVALVGEKDARNEKMKKTARALLEPALKMAPQHAISTASEMANAVQAQATEKTAQYQATESVLHWVRYVAQTSIGTKSALRGTPGGEPTVETSHANQVTSQASQSPDGLVQVAFSADAINAAKPVTVEAVTLNGVSKAVLSRVRKNALTAPLAIRATARFEPGGIEVIRDEAGDVDVDDESGAPGMPGNWFERRSGRPNGGRDAALRAGKEVMQEVIGQMQDFLVSDDKIQGDSNT